jgi:hypothetical protein
LKEKSIEVKEPKFRKEAYGMIQSSTEVEVTPSHTMGRSGLALVRSSVEQGVKSL